MRVLLIEDDSATAQSIELMLKSESFNLYTTESARKESILVRSMTTISFSSTSICPTCRASTFCAVCARPRSRPRS